MSPNTQGILVLAKAPRSQLGKSNYNLSTWKLVSFALLETLRASSLSKEMVSTPGRRLLSNLTVLQIVVDECLVCKSTKCLC